jgi:hypothetical protein
VTKNRLTLKELKMKNISKQAYTVGVIAGVVKHATDVQSIPAAARYYAKGSMPLKGFFAPPLLTLKIPQRDHSGGDAQRTDDALQTIALAEQMATDQGGKQHRDFPRRRDVTERCRLHGIQHQYI